MAPKRTPHSHDRRRFWYDFGRFNLTGWSIVLPTLGGLALGIWLDRTHPASFSWAISLMIVGLVLGCMNAWYWIRRIEHHHQEKKDKEAE